MNRRHIISLLLVFTLLVPTIAFANEPDGCPPLGQPLIGPLPPYDYIANGYPNYNSCWSVVNTVFTTGYDSCNYFRNYWDFNYAGSLTQTLTIPASHVGTYHLNLYYQLDFDDPNHDGAWNRFTSNVMDSTAGRYLGGEFYSGSSPSLYCSQRKISISSPVDLAGHTLTVYFTGSRAYTNTHIHLKYVSLLRQ